MFGAKTEKTTEEWRRLQNEKCQNIRANKSRRVRWVGHVAQMGR
jgi:hypothetical protein